jgi:predicted GH43/DUF377 family glycosyl hydrolase
MKTFTFFVCGICMAAVSMAQPQFPFLANPGNPVLSHSDPGSWDAAGMISPNIVFDNGTYYLFYNGFEASGQAAIGYATSNDGYNFTKVTVSAPVFAPDGTGFDAWLVSDPVIIREDNLWVMYYGARQFAGAGPGPCIGRAMANDLSGPWTREENPILSVGGFNEWDSYFVVPNAVLHTDNGMIMYYSGAAGLAGGWRMGMAYNEGSGWVKHDDPATTAPPYAESDPVLTTGEAGAWDSNVATFGFVKKISTGFEMFYLGETSISAGLGYATSNDGITWVKSLDNPVYTYLDDPFAVSNDLYVLELPSVFVTNDFYLIYYDYGLGMGKGYIGMATAPALAQVIHVPAEQPTIQSAINIATTGDTVLVADGTYFENINFLGKAITVASHFIMDADTNHISNTIIDGSQAASPDSASVVSLVMGEDTTSVIMGFTITGGSGTLNQEINELVGGGIYLINSGATISHNRIINNHISGIGITAGGAGIFCEALETANFLIIDNNEILNNSTKSNSLIAYAAGIYSSTSCRIKNNLIEYNSCMSPGNNLAHGGGMTIFPYSVPRLIATIKDNIIRHNSLQGLEANGAGIFTYVVDNLQISGNDISYNNVFCPSSGYGNGGGIMVFLSSESVIIENNDIIGNEIYSGDWARGGGIALWEPSAKVDINNNNIMDNLVQGLNNRGPGVWFRYPSGKVTITGNTFMHNTGPKTAITSAAGGGLCVMDATGDVIIDQNKFLDNEIYNGGGLYIRNSASSKISNNLFAGNSAIVGSGFSYYSPQTNKYFKASPSSPLIVNNTFANNSASNYGGGIFINSYVFAPEIYNTIFWNNNASLGSDILCQGSISFTINYSDFDPEHVGGSWSGVGNIFADPLFDLSDPDPYALMPNSPCIDTGTPDTTGLNLPPCDIMGCVRIWDGDGDGISVIDMGAYEFDSPMVGIPQFKIQNSKFKIQNYPNPTGGITHFAFHISQYQWVSLKIYDVHGREVAVVLDGACSGDQVVRWDASNLAPGVYFYRLAVGGQRSAVCGKIMVNH